MKWRQFGFLTLAACASISVARTGELPTPRAPIGPQSLDLLPPNVQLPQQLPGPHATIPNRVRILNMGDQTISLVFWDGSDWKTIAIGSGLTQDVVCAPCGPTIRIAFHNGKDNRMVDARTSTVYVIWWSSQLRAWDLTPQNRPLTQQ